MLRENVGKCARSIGQRRKMRALRSEPAVTFVVVISAAAVAVAAKAAVAVVVIVVVAVVVVVGKALVRELIEDHTARELSTQETVIEKNPLLIKEKAAAARLCKDPQTRPHPVTSSCAADARYTLEPLGTVLPAVT